MLFPHVHDLWLGFVNLAVNLADSSNFSAANRRDSTPLRDVPIDGFARFERVVGDDIR